MKNKTYFEVIHTNGMTRHPQEWLSSISRAKEASAYYGGLDKPCFNEALSAITLRILDGIKIDQGFAWDEEKREWRRE